MQASTAVLSSPRMNSGDSAQGAIGRSDGVSHMTIASWSGPLLTSPMQLFGAGYGFLTSFCEGRTAMLGRHHPSWRHDRLRAS
jgi:hypothetical protein